jgi:hypothetical protein
MDGWDRREGRWKDGREGMGWVWCVGKLKRKLERQWGSGGWKNRSVVSWLASF